jgi:hypothetical protein
MAPEELSGIWDDYHFEVGLDHSLLQEMNAQAAWAIRMGTQKGPIPNYMQMIDSAPLASIDRSRVHLADGAGK